jgi:hypothetical protein
MKGLMMKRIALAAAAVLMAFAAMAATPPPAPPEPPRSGWIFVESKKADTHLLVSVRDEVPADVQPSKYPNVVEMHWRYKPDNIGLPAPAVVTQISKFEATIDPLQGDKLGFPMMIVTGSGERTWLWYVADPKAFTTALNRLLPGHPFPVVLNAAAKEPDWKTYRAMRAKIH